jgi:hypothetical protein
MPAGAPASARAAWVRSGMLQTPSSSRQISGVDLATRRTIAFDRIQQLIAGSDDQARRAFRRYFVTQALTVGLAAITPCLIFLAKDNPRNELLNWLQIFVPALAATAAAVSHIFRWREDGVRQRTLAEAVRSLLWRFQTRAGEFGVDLTEDQALDRLVVKVDEVNLQSVARWSAAQLAETPAPTGDKAKSAPAAAHQ